MKKEKIIYEKENHSSVKNIESEIEWNWKASLKEFKKEKTSYTTKYYSSDHYIEILFLKYYFEGKWVVENVNPFYDPLIKPTAKIGRHLFWSNFEIASIGFGDADIHSGKREDLQSAHGFDISGYQFTIRKDKILRNCVKPELGAHILRESKRVGMFTF